MTSFSRAIAAIGLSGLSLMAGATTVFNDDFSRAGVGETDYSPGPAPGFGGADTTPGTYAVVSDPGQYFKSQYAFARFYDHTSGSVDGWMAFFDGAENPSSRVWYTTVSLTAGIRYAFSFWLAAATQSSPPNLAFSLDQEQVGTTLTTDAAATWVQYATSFIPTVTGDVLFAITDLNAERIGNDFAIDDVSLTFEPQVGDPGGSGNPVPEPEQAALMAGGLAVLAWTTRRRAPPALFAAPLA